MESSSVLDGFSKTVNKQPNVFDKWCSTGTTSRDVDLHFSETRDFYSVVFEVRVLSSVVISPTRARRIQRIFAKGGTLSRAFYAVLISVVNRENETDGETALHTGRDSVGCTYI